MPKICKLPKIQKSSMLGMVPGLERGRGNWLKVKNKALNLGDKSYFDLSGSNFL